MEITEGWVNINNNQRASAQNPKRNLTQKDRNANKNIMIFLLRFGK
jgi:hypothetical protein